MSAHPPYFSNAEILTLDPTTIDPDFNGRIGLYYPAKCEALAALISVHGQNEPIKVVKSNPLSKTPWRLVAGSHRLHACISLGIDVRAIEVMGDDAALAQIQASENMDRRELEPLERALFVHAVAEAAKKRVLAEHGVDSQAALAGKARQNKVQYTEQEKADEVAASAVDNLSTAYSWKAEVAESLGLGAKEIQRSIRIYRCICEPLGALTDKFKDHPVAKVADNLLKLAALERGIRLQVINVLLAGPADLDYALRHVGVIKDAPYQSPYTKFSSQILGGWGRLGTAERRKFIPELVTAIPVGMRDDFVREIERQKAENSKAGGDA